jgi:hypothetical protein
MADIKYEIVKNIEVLSGSAEGVTVHDARGIGRIAGVSFG